MEAGRRDAGPGGGHRGADVAYHRGVGESEAEYAKVAAWQM